VKEATMPRPDPDYDEIAQDHLDGLHYGSPDPDCVYCELDGEPEAPDPW
jgi:hypothetical protein